MTENTFPEPQIDALLSQWQLAFAEGREITPAELCKDCPDLERELANRISYLRALQQQEATRGWAETIDAPPLPESEEATPSAVDRYVKRNTVGKGGIGQVFLAYDQELKREVALKEIQPQHAFAPHFRPRFLLEAEITGRLEHPGIVPVYSMGQYPDGRPYYAMRLIRGSSLSQAIREFHTQPVTEKHDRLLALRKLLASFVTVCNTMAFAHSRGVIHRDIKPDNIMLGPFGETLVVDWGLAKIVAQDASTATITPPELADTEEMEDSTAKPGMADLQASPQMQTRAGSVVGTPYFMSPEQARGEIVGPASDIYSLGSTLYNLLTNKYPYEGRDSSAVLMQVRNGAFRSPHERDRSIPTPLNAIVCKAMARKPEDRYATARELGDDIERWLADEPVKAAPESLGQKVMRLSRRYRTLTQVVGVALLLVTMISVLALLLVSNARQRERREFQARLLLRDLQDVWQKREWTPDVLSQADTLADQLARIDPAEAERAQSTNLKVYAENIAAAIQRAELDRPHLERIQTNLTALRERAPTEAGDLDGLLQKRLAEWREIFDLKAPFTNLGTTFAGKPFQIHKDVLRLTGEQEGQVLFPTRVDCTGNVRLKATFSPTWLQGQFVGIILNHTDQSSYRFLVSIPEYIKESTVIGDQPHFDHLPSLAETLRARVPVHISILRNKVVLRQLVTLLPQGELHLTAGREGDRVTFQVNNQPPLEFTDPFPITPSRSGVFALNLSSPVEVIRLTGYRQSLAPQASPLEKGDELFAQQKFADALAFYQRQVVAGSDRVIQQQARFKQAQTLQEMGQSNEAQSIWVGLQKELPEDPNSPEARWPLRAACQVWLNLIRAKDYKGAENFLDNLGRGYDFVTLAPLIPAAERQAILDVFRIRGSRFRSAFDTLTNLTRIQKSLAVEDKINESPYENRMTRWSLWDVYRMLGDRVNALRVRDELLALPNVPVEERVAYLREYVWMMIEAKTPEKAFGEVNRYLDELATDPVAVPLYLERCRLYIAQQKWEEAEKDLGEFFERANKKILDYADWGDGCLIKGFLLERRGKIEEAKQAWREGRLRDWPGGPPRLPTGRLLSGIASINWDRTIFVEAVQASLTGEITRNETEFIYQGVTGGYSGSTSKIVYMAIKKAFPLDFIQKVILSTYSSKRGRDFARRAVYRQVSLLKYCREPLILAFKEGIHHGAYPERTLPDGLEAIMWKGAEDLFLYWDKGKIDDKVAEDILTIWRGKADKSDILKAWNQIAPRLEPDLRIPSAMTFGKRLKIMENAETALVFFQEVVQANSNPILTKLAREQIEEIKKLKKP